MVEEIDILSRTSWERVSTEKKYLDDSRYRVSEEIREVELEKDIESYVRIKGVDTKYEIPGNSSKKG